VRIIWRRLLTNPTTRIESQSGERTRLKVEGLVCDEVCAVRTKQALEALPGVHSATVDLDTGIATIEGQAHTADAYECAVTRAVAGKPVRRVIERIHRAGRPSALSLSPDAGAGQLPPA
jgi:copper chaperone CopZ